MESKPKEKAIIDLSIVEGFDHLDEVGFFSSIHSYNQSLIELNRILKRFFKTEQFIIGNGIDELIDLLFLFFKQDLKLKKILILEPEYGRYKQSILRYGIKPIGFPRVILYKEKLYLQSIDNIITFIEKNNIDAVVFSNPGNPYPGYYTKEEIEKMMNKINPSTFVVIDEAFVEYAVKNNSLTTLELIKKFKNLFVLRTFSKIYGIFGLRVGMLFNDGYIQKILHYKRKYTISQSSAIELIKILKSSSIQKYWINTYTNNKNGLQTFAKKAQDKYSIITGSTNFVLFLCDKPTSFLFKVKDVTEKFNIKGKYLYRVAIPNKEIIQHIEF